MVLTCYFASQLIASTARSTLLLHSHDSGCARSWQFLRFWPVAAFTTRSLTASPASAPLQDCYHPAGSKRSAGLAVNRPAFRLRPISLRSPQPVSISSGSAADQRSRSATFSVACCSSNLLEPSSLCSPNYLRSMKFRDSGCVFLSIYLFSYQILTEICRRIACG